MAIMDRLAKKVIKSASEPVKEELKKVVDEKKEDLMPFVKIGITLVVGIGGILILRNKPTKVATVIHNYYGPVYKIVSH